MIEKIQELQNKFLKSNPKFETIKVVILPHTFCIERMDTNYEYQTDWYDSIEEVVEWLANEIQEIK